MIPKIIHQTWKNEVVPDKWKTYHQTWKDNFPEPEYKHILWTDEDNRNLIKKNYNWFLETYDNYPKNIQRADAIRYFILYHYGGIYADLDCEVRENFYDQLSPDKINLAESPYHSGTTMNNLMASNKHNELWLDIFNNLEDKKNIKATIASTGPAILNILKTENIRILDVDNYNPLKKRPWWRHHIENTFFTKLNLEKSKNWDNAKVVHHGSESWAWEEIKHDIKFFYLFLVLASIFVLLYFSVKIYRKNKK